MTPRDRSLTAVRDRGTALAMRRWRNYLNYVSSIERGERNAGVLTLLKLTRGLDVPIGALLDEFPPSTIKRLRL
jgi:hypothetical protein